MPRPPALLPLPLLLLLLELTGGTSAYFADWGVIGGRPQEPTCVDIPQNMPLCSGIDYTKMRLPNLLDHDTLKEAQQQAGYWVPLLNLRCHPDTQLFLCSLFTPVCLESPIYPCRSLCEAVRNGCERRMQTYSFPWPEMLRCDKFPLDNDMCITVQHTKAPGPEIMQDEDCEPCSPVETYENILDNFCRADVVVKTRVRRQHRSKLSCKRSRVYKSGNTEEERRAMRRPRFSLTSEAACCTITPSKKPYLIMARQQGDNLVPTFVMPFKKSKPLRQAVKMFRGLNCSDPNVITNNLEPTSLSQEPPQPQEPQVRRRKNRKSRRRNGRKGASGSRSSSSERPPRPRPDHNHDMTPPGVVDISVDIASEIPNHVSLDPPQPPPQSQEELRQGVRQQRRRNKASRRERRRKNRDKVKKVMAEAMEEEEMEERGEDMVMEEPAVVNSSEQ